MGIKQSFLDRQSWVSDKDINYIFHKSVFSLDFKQYLYHNAFKIYSINLVIFSFTSEMVIFFKLLLLIIFCIYFYV